jgi:sulfur carrier protein
MNVSINNKAIVLGLNSHLFTVLELLELKNTKGIALAVNNQVVPKSDWESFVLSENDKVTLIKATQGG